MNRGKQVRFCPPQQTFLYHPCSELKVEPSSTLLNQANMTAGSSSQMPQTLAHSSSVPIVQTLSARPDLASLLLCQCGCARSSHDILCSETLDGPPLREQTIEQTKHETRTSDLRDFTPSSRTTLSLSTLYSNVLECSRTGPHLCGYDYAVTHLPDFVK